MIVNILALLVLIASGTYDLSNLKELEKDSQIIAERFSNATKQKIEAWKPPNHIDSIFPQASTYFKLTRWILKKINKWRSSHPAEEKLMKCLAKFLPEKIFKMKKKLVELPLPKDQKLRENEVPQKPETEITKLQELEDEKCEEKNLFCLIEEFERMRKVKRWLLKLKERVYHFLGDNIFLYCTWEYVVKRFWLWVDAAPDY